MKGLMGNWLNWKQAPNPHNHLSKFLTPDQLEAVYNLPRNSKEQVDLVLGFMDDDQVVDEAFAPRPTNSSSGPQIRPTGPRIRPTHEDADRASVTKRLR